jgi:hypothetical protein
MISVLIPSRGRFDSLLKTVGSFCAQAITRDFEVLIKLDSDDHESIRRLGELDNFGPSIHVVVGPRLRGYFDLNKFYNCLAALSSGRWLFLFNDDARMVTTGWDLILNGRADSARPVFIWPHTEWDYPAHGPNRLADLAIYAESKHYDFPIISRGAYDLMGHFSMSCLNDVYIYDVAVRSNSPREETTALVVTHTYARDETHPHNLNVDGAVTEHRAPAIQRHIDLAVNRLASVL